MRPILPKGITLIESVLYIGLIMIVLPMLVSFLLRLHSQQTLFDARVRMEQTASLVLSELQTVTTAADAVAISTSVLGVNPSTLRLTDENGMPVVIDSPTVAVSFPGGTQNVRRLRYQSGANPAIWLTDSDINVVEWQVVAVRNSANILTGLRIDLDLAMIAAGTDSDRSAEFAGVTTFSLSPHTREN